MAGSGNLVGRASVEVEAGGVDGFRFQEEVAGWVHGRLLPELEALLDSLAQFDGHVVLERLDVSIEAGAVAEWRDRAITGLRDALMRELRRKMSDSTAEGARLLTPAEAFLRGWTHYLEHGALPWNWILPDGSAMEARIDAWLDGIEASAPDPGRASSLARSLRTHDARRRLLALPDDRIARILASVFGIDLQTTRRWMRDLARMETRLATGPAPVARALPRGRTDLYEEVLASLSTRPIQASEEIEHRIGLAIRRRLGEHPESLARLPGIEFESPAFRALQIEVDPGSSRLAAGAGATTGRGEDDVVEPSHPSRADERRRNSTSGDLPDDAPRPSDATESRISEGFHIHHAGLVLVAPYLPLLFDRLGWSLPKREGEGRVPGDHASALTLLHHLATGRDDPYEFELVLAKVFCGMEPEESYEGPVALDARSREEADQLLESVLGHWGALKDTSIGGLREAFLQRSGKLSLGDGFWRLQVEQKPWDMLLEQLPWSIQFTRFPWMSRTLKTEWME